MTGEGRDSSSAAPDQTFLELDDILWFCKPVWQLAAVSWTGPHPVRRNLSRTVSGLTPPSEPASILQKPFCHCPKTQTEEKSSPARQPGGPCPAARQPGSPAARRPGGPAARQPGIPPTRQPGQLAGFETKKAYRRNRLLTFRQPDPNNHTTNATYKLPANFLNNDSVQNAKAANVVRSGPLLSLPHYFGAVGTLCKGWADFVYFIVNAAGLACVSLIYWFPQQ